MMTKEEFQAKRERAEKEVSEAKNMFTELLCERAKELNENTYKEFIGKKVEVTIADNFRGYGHPFTIKGHFNGVRIDAFNRIVVTLNRIKKDGTRSVRGTVVEEDRVIDVKIL